MCFIFVYWKKLLDFACGHPPYYSPRPSLLNLTEWTGSGTVKLVWPMTRRRYIQVGFSQNLDESGLDRSFRRMHALSLVRTKSGCQSRKPRGVLWSISQCDLRFYLRVVAIVRVYYWRESVRTKVGSRPHRYYIHHASIIYFCTGGFHEQPAVK